jgi:hypothetical protein
MRSVQLLGVAIMGLMFGIAGIVGGLVYLQPPPVVFGVGWTAGGFLALRARRCEGKRMAGHVIAAVAVMALGMFVASLVPLREV